MDPRPLLLVLTDTVLLMGGRDEAAAFLRRSLARREQKYRRFRNRFAYTLGAFLTVIGVLSGLGYDDACTGAAAIGVLVGLAGCLWLIELWGDVLLVRREIREVEALPEDACWREKHS